ncbi:MAG: hypothetical protein RLZZ123_870, partial [Pseudomonadota bacterium]
MLTHDLQQGVGSRVGVATRGMVFERGLGQGPALTQLIGQASGVGITGHPGSHALQTIKNALGTSEPVLRQQGRHQPGTGSMGSVQLLAVGGGAQKFPQARRLRARRTKGMQHLGWIKPDQV